MKDDNGAAAPEGGLETFAPYLMNRIMRRYNDNLGDAMAEVGLTVPRMRVLSVLHQKGALTINELTILAVSEQSTMSRLIDTMVDEGLVSRTTSETDHRVRLVDLTATGREAHDRMWPRQKAEQDRLLACLADDERQLFLMLLRKVLRAVRRNPL